MRLGFCIISSIQIWSLVPIFRFFVLQISTFKTYSFLGQFWYVSMLEMTRNSWFNFFLFLFELNLVFCCRFWWIWISHLSNSFHVLLRIQIFFLCEYSFLFFHFYRYLHFVWLNTRDRLVVFIWNVDVVVDFFSAFVYLIKFVFLDEALLNRSWKLAPQRRSQRHMGGQMQQSNAAAATALYDHAGGGTLHNAGPTNDAGDAVMARWLQSAGLQHLASPLADQRSLLMQVCRLLSPTVSVCFFGMRLKMNLPFFSLSSTICGMRGGGFEHLWVESTYCILDELCLFCMNLPWVFTVEGHFFLLSFSSACNLQLLGVTCEIINV